jgi:uncharacterized protein
MKNNEKLVPLSAFKSEILSSFECMNSGNCCRAEGFVSVSSVNVSKMAAILGLGVQEFLSKYTQTNNGWTRIATPKFRPSCFLTCENKCGVYAARPTHCKTYPDWPEIWRSEKELQEEINRCPGLKSAVDKLLKSN